MNSGPDWIGFIPAVERVVIDIRQRTTTFFSNRAEQVERHRSHCDDNVMMAMDDTTCQYVDMPKEAAIS